MVVGSGAALGQSQGADFYTVTPCRIYDSRDGDGPFEPGEQRELQVATACGIPYDAVAVAANVTAVDPTATGNFSIFPDSTHPTGTNALSHKPGVTIAVGGIYPLSGNGLGTLSLLTDLPAGQVDLVFDVTGYFVRGSGGPSPVIVPACKTGSPVKAIDCWEGSIKLSGSIPAVQADRNAFYTRLYRDAKIKITFTRTDPAPEPGHQAPQYSTYAYWDGELNFTFRTAFPFQRTWKWEAVCEEGCQDRTLSQTLGSVTVDPRRQSPLIYSRGFLKAHDSGRYLVHQNGTKFFWLGDTAWAAPMRTFVVANSGSTWTTYLDDRTTTPSNYPTSPSAPTAGKYSVIQVSLAFHAGAGGYTACTGLECIPLAKRTAFTTPGSIKTVPSSSSYWNPEYWRNLDRLVYQANEKGLVVVLTGVMDPFGVGSNNLADGDSLTTFARNLTARMAGFFVIYSVGWDNRVESATYACGSDTNASSVVNGFTKDTALVTKMNAVGSALDAVNHAFLITTHLGGASPFLGADSYFHDPGADNLNTPLASPYSYFHREPWLDFHLVQSGQCNTQRASTFLNQGTRDTDGSCKNFVQEQQLACVMRRARTMPPKFLSLKSDDTPLGSSPLVKPVVNGEARYERTVLTGDPEVVDIAYQSRHAGHVTTLSGAFGFTGGVYNVGEWRWPGDGMGITGDKAGKSPRQLKYLSVLQEGQIMEWERLRRKEAMLRNAGTDENERSVVAVSESNKTIVAYLPERTTSDQRNLQLAINQGVYVNFDSCRWSKKWWSPFSGTTRSVESTQLSKSLRTCESAEPAPCYTFKFDAPPCTGDDLRPNDRCDWVLLLNDLGACPAASGQTEIWSGLDDSAGQWGVFAQERLPTGEPTGPIVPVGGLSASVQAVPKVGRDTGQEALVAWVAEDADGEGYGIVARKLDGSGLPVGDIIRVSDPSQGDQVSPSVAAVGQTGYVVTWTSYTEDNDQGEVYARYLDGDGNPLASQFQVNVTSAGEQGHSQVASDPRGNVIIAWESWGQDGDGNGVFARRFDPSHTGSEEFQVYRAGGGWQYLAGLSARPAGGFEVRWQVYTLHGHDLGTWGQRIKVTGPPRDGDEFSVAGPG
jgi:hypothetical protein